MKLGVWKKETFINSCLFSNMMISFVENVRKNKRSIIKVFLIHFEVLPLLYWHFKICSGDLCLESTARTNFLPIIMMVAKCFDSMCQSTKSLSHVYHEFLKTPKVSFERDVKAICWAKRLKHQQKFLNSTDRIDRY